VRGHGLGRWDGDGPILLGRCVNNIWVLKMIFAVLRSTSPKLQRQKGLIVRLRAAGVNTLDAHRILWLLEANLRRFEEHRDRLRESLK
jgi:hypothetical protein